MHRTVNAAKWPHLRSESAGCTANQMLRCASGPIRDDHCRLGVQAGCGIHCAPLPSRMLPRTLAARAEERWRVARPAAASADVMLSPAWVRRSTARPPLPPLVRDVALVRRHPTQRKMEARATARHGEEEASEDRLLILRCRESAAAEPTVRQPATPERSPNLPTALEDLDRFWAGCMGVTVTPPRPVGLSGFAAPACVAPARNLMCGPLPTQPAAGACACATAAWSSPGIKHTILGTPLVAGPT